MVDDTLHHSFSCPVCWDTMYKPILLTPCGHTVCSLCFSRLNQRCPLCRESIGSSVDNLHLRNVIEDYLSSSNAVSSRNAGIQRQLSSVEHRLNSVKHRMIETSKEKDEARHNIDVYRKVVNHFMEKEKELLVELQQVRDGLNESNSKLDTYVNLQRNLEVQETKLGNLQSSLQKEFNKLTLLARK
ncbi:hypothetical protein P9112_003063 [Eukaryota sp. TZLM1-RC]